MKAKLSVLTVAVITICTSWISPASTAVITGQQLTISKTITVPDFAFFRTHRQGRNGVGASWGLVSNSGVSGFVLQRTYEDPYDPYSEWFNVCNLPCDNNRQYRHTDANLTPGFISYRVVAVDNGGVPLGMSEISTIQIVQH